MIGWAARNTLKYRGEVRVGDRDSRIGERNQDEQTVAVTDEQKRLRHRQESLLTFREGLRHG